MKRKIKIGDIIVARELNFHEERIFNTEWRVIEKYDFHALLERCDKPIAYNISVDYFDLWKGDNYVRY